MYQKLQYLTTYEVVSLPNYIPIVPKEHTISTLAFNNKNQCIERFRTKPSNEFHVELCFHPSKASEVARTRWRCRRGGFLTRFAQTKGNSSPLCPPHLRPLPISLLTGEQKDAALLTISFLSTILIILIY